MQRVLVVVVLLMPAVLVDGLLAPILSSAKEGFRSVKAAILPAYAEVQAVASYVHQGAANGGVNVVTYNVQEAPVSGLQSGLTSKDRVQYIPGTQTIKDRNNDIVVFTNVYRDSSFRDLKTLMSSNGFASTSAPGQPMNVKSSGGVFIAVRTPVLRQDTRVFSKCGCYTTCLMSSPGFVYVETTMADQKVAIVGTSLQADGVTGCSATEVQDARRTQVEEIRQFLSENAQQMDIVILAGDLNVNNRPDASPTEANEYRDLMSLIGAGAVEMQGGTLTASCDPNTNSEMRLQGDSRLRNSDYVLSVAVNGKPAHPTVNEVQAVKHPLKPQQDLSSHHAVAGFVALSGGSIPAPISLVASLLVLVLTCST